MALKNCAECGQPVSTKASKCPNCGAPTTSPVVVGIGCLVLLLILGGGCLLSVRGCGSVDPDAWRTTDNSVEAYVMMQDFVRDRLKAPATAEFPWDGVSATTKVEDRKYRIRSYVDSQNSFGALIRTTYVGELEQVDRTKWKLISLELEE